MILSEGSTGGDSRRSLLKPAGEVDHCDGQQSPLYLITVCLVSDGALLVVSQPWHSGGQVQLTLNETVLEQMV